MPGTFGVMDMNNVFQRAAGKRLQQKKAAVNSEVSLNEIESERLLNDFRDVITQVESAQHNNKEQAINCLQDLHKRHQGVLKNKCLTGPVE